MDVFNRWARIISSTIHDEISARIVSFPCCEGRLWKSTFYFKQKSIFLDLPVKRMTFLKYIYLKQGMPVAKLFDERRGLSGPIMFWITSAMVLLMVYGLGMWLPQLMGKAGYPLTNRSLMYLFALNIGAIFGADWWRTVSQSQR